MAHMALLVLKTPNLGFFATLARDLPVWIADTPDHASLTKMKAANDGHMLTWFPLRERETLEASAFRIGPLDRTGLYEARSRLGWIHGNEMIRVAEHPLCFRRPTISPVAPGYV